MERRIFMNKKTTIILISVFLVLAIALTAAWFLWGEKAMGGYKEITIEVVNQAGESVVYEIKTQGEYLKEAMDEIEGLTYELESGMVLAVNGESAIYTVDNAYWGFFVNGDYCNYGIETQPIADGDAFQIIYTPA